MSRAPTAVAATLAVTVALAVVLTVAAAVPAASDPPGPVAYRPPVGAPVSDPFRPPSTPYGRGNRGLEYDTEPGQRVRAAAAGEVAFAGSVGRARWVTIRHADGLRTTYGPLARIAAGIERGGPVAAGVVVGTAGEELLWTARLGDAYLDPAVLLSASGRVRVRLVPDRRRGPVGVR